MKNLFNKIRNYTNNLPLDRQIHIEVLLILGFMSVLTGFQNLVVSFPFWYTIMFFIAAIFTFALVLLNYYKGWYKTSKLISIVFLYLMTIVSWIYSDGMNGSALLFISAIVIFTIGFYPKIYLPLFILNFIVFSALILTTFWFPGAIQHRYINEAERVTDLMSSYLIITVSVVFILKVILNNYDRISEITKKQKLELELLNNELKHVNEELVYMNASKDKLFSIIGHDLRSPISSMLRFSGTLSENIESFDTAAIKEHLRVMNQTQKKTLNLLEDLLLWSKSQSDKLLFIPSKTELAEITKEIIEEMRNQATHKNISLECLVTPGLFIRSDINMLKTILRNLISNAIKFTAENGSVSISSEEAEGEATITVSDTGIGIESESVAKLWDIKQQFSTKGTDEESGTGLGLILCKEFVEKHGCKIWVVSEPGIGSDFKFTMPLFSMEYTTS
jgi:signal transduction histidine kinase